MITRFFHPRVLLASVFCVAAVLLAAISFGAGFKTKLQTGNSNGSWTVQPSPNLPRQWLGGVTCNSESDCWTVGSYYSEHAFQTLIEHWNGSSWSIVTSANSSDTVNHELYAITCQATSNCWAVGASYSNGGTDFTLIEHWDGTSWSIVQSPNIPDKTNNLNDVTCSSASNCWAVGVSSTDTVSQTLIERWDGIAWTIVASPNTSTSQSNYLFSAVCAAASDCWAVGRTTNGGLIEHWNGAYWTIVDSPNELGNERNRLLGITCVSASDCWAAGYRRNFTTNVYQPHVEHWDGVAWSVMATPASPSSSVTLLTDVACTSAGDCWAVGYSEDDIEGLVTYREHWDGMAWSIVSSPGYHNRSYLSGLSCSSASACWAVGDTDGSHTYIERWDGSSWSIAVSANASGISGYTQLHDVACTSVNDCWAVGSYIIAHWNGTSWSIALSPYVANLSGISCTSESNCWAVGTEYRNGTEHTAIQHWDGNSWSIVNAPNGNEADDNYLTGISCGSAFDCWAIGYFYNDDDSSIRGSFFEHWNGNSWTRLPAPEVKSATSDRLQDISCVSPSDCWAVGFYKTDGDETTLYPEFTLIEHWNGSSWSIVASPNQDQYYGNILSSVGCVSSSDCWAVGYVFQHWDGTTWTIVPTENHESASGVTCASHSNCWAVNGGQRIQHWDGNAWTRQEVEAANTPGFPYETLEAVTCPSETRCWTVGYKEDTEPHYNARTLIEQFTPKPPLVNAVSRLSHGGSGPFDIDLESDGATPVECRRGGANNEFTLVLTFADPLTNVENLSVHSIEAEWWQEIAVPATATIGTDPRQLLVNMSGVPNAKHVAVDLRHVRDALGNVANFWQPIDFLVGDTNRDGSVNSADISQTKSQSGQGLTNINFREDLNSDGVINSADIALAKSKSGSALPISKPGDPARASSIRWGDSEKAFH